LKHVPTGRTGAQVRPYVPLPQGPTRAPTTKRHVKCAVLQRLWSSHQTHACWTSRGLLEHENAALFLSWVVLDLQADPYDVKPGSKQRTERSGGSDALPDPHTDSKSTQIMPEPPGAGHPRPYSARQHSNRCHSHVCRGKTAGRTKRYVRQRGQTQGAVTGGQSPLPSQHSRIT